MPIFLEELHECISDMKRHLLSLQQNPEPSVHEILVNELYRAAHSVKGAANAAEVRPIEQLCRQMQDILTAVRDGQRMIDRDLLSQFANAVSFLEISAARLRDGGLLGSGAEIFHQQ